MNVPYPAVLIGGPPDSGKSWLTYCLTQALRARSVPHFVIRAAPDGEGDWYHEADRTLVQELRYAGRWSPEFADRVTSAIRRRHYPLLVDAGGRPKRWQEGIFRECTHAILLIRQNRENPGAYERDLAEWQEIMRRNRVTIIAELTSNRTGEARLQSRQPVLQGTLAEIAPDKLGGDATFAALLTLLQGIFTFSHEELAAQHLPAAPLHPVIDLERWASNEERWQPQMLPAFLSTIPAHTSLSLYGRAPNWVYAAAAIHTAPAAIYLFDPRYGWIAPPVLPLYAANAIPSPAQCQPGWAVKTTASDNIHLVDIARHSQYLDLYQPHKLPLPHFPSADGIVLSGSIPYWLVAEAARLYAPHSRWLAVYQPPLDGVVVVHTTTTRYEPGHYLSTAELPFLLPRNKESGETAPPKQFA